MRPSSATLSAFAALQLVAVPLSAQIGLASRPQSVELFATKRASLGLALPDGRTAPLANTRGDGANDFAPLPVVTTWNLDPARTSIVAVAAFFDAPKSALAAADVEAPASRLSGRMPIGGPKSFQPFTGSALVSHAGMIGRTGGMLVLFAQPIVAETAVGTRTDELQIRTDLSGINDLPSGTFRETLNLVATTQ